MFGIPLEVISMLISTMLGGYMKMKADAREDEHARNMMTLKLLNFEEKAVKGARTLQTKSAKWARKFIVVTLMALAAFILVAPVLWMTPTNVLGEVTHGFKIWLFDFTWTSMEWKELTGIVCASFAPTGANRTLVTSIDTAAGQ